MITIAVALYAFVAGMTAEWSHTRQKTMGHKGYLAITSLIAGLMWPVTLWRISSCRG